ncbi:MAG: glycosyltransferase [Pseudomonadota bacterium]
MNAFGKTLLHTVVSGVPDQMGARELIDRSVPVSFPADFPSLSGFPSPGRLVTIAKALKPFDLILTYNWGAMDVVMAHSIYAKHFDLPPLIHHEDGFNEDEADQLKSSRNWYRRIALRRAFSLVVPSQVLENIALSVWKQPPSHLMRISNGIDTKALAGKPKPNALRVVKREGEHWIGTLAGLRPVKQLSMLVEACVGLPENWHLVILGDGTDKEAILETAAKAEISHRVHLPGSVGDPAAVIGLFDIFALSSKSEQFPLSVAEAMAAGLPVAAPDVGDIRNMLSTENRPYVAVPNDLEALSLMLEDLVADAELRQTIGKANQAKAREHYDAKTMIERYRNHYSSALGRQF